MSRLESRTSGQHRTRSAASPSFRSSSTNTPRDQSRGFERVPVLKEYAASLDDDDLKYVHLRLEHRFHRDLEEALLAFQTEVDVDEYLNAAGTAGDFHARLDSLANHLRAEYHRRMGR